MQIAEQNCFFGVTIDLMYKLYYFLIYSSFFCLFIACFIMNRAKQNYNIEVISFLIFLLILLFVLLLILLRI